MSERPDEIGTATAAALLGVTPRRLRQLADEGFIVIHRRGFTSVASAVGGYVRALRADGKTSEASASAARQHSAKASLIRAHTSRKKAALTERLEAEEVIRAIADASVRRLRDARLPASIPTTTGASFKSEIAGACRKIEQARDCALRALATGDLTELDGGANG